MKNSFTLSGLYNSKSLLTTFLSLLAGCLYLKGKRIKTVSYSDDLAITRNIQAQYIASSIIPLTAKIMISNHIVELRAFVTRKEKRWRVKGLQDVPLVLGGLLTTFSSNNAMECFLSTGLMCITKLRRRP